VAVRIRALCAFNPLPDVYLKHGIGMVVAPVPISLPLPLGRAIPVDGIVVPLLPVGMPGAVFMFVEIVVVLVVLVVDVVMGIIVMTIIPTIVSVMTIIPTIVAVVMVIPTIVVILGQQRRRNEQRHS
jgi:hypothetical protein